MNASCLKVRRMGIFGNPLKSELPPAVELISNLCDEHGVSITASADLAGVLGQNVPALSNAELVKAVDVVIAFGGDGTMLRAARVLGQTGVPLLGINLGSLGYLTDVPLGELKQAVLALIEGDYHLDTRSRVYCNVIRT